MHNTGTRATIVLPTRACIAMKSTTHARLRRTAVEAVGSIPGIEAVLLGSRAHGTARRGTRPGTEARDATRDTRSRPNPTAGNECSPWRSCAPARV